MATVAAVMGVAARAGCRSTRVLMRIKLFADSINRTSCCPGNPQWPLLEYVRHGAYEGMYAAEA